MSEDRTLSMKWVVVVPRLWGACRVSPEFDNERAARDWLAQFGPLDGVIRDVP